MSFVVARIGRFASGTRSADKIGVGLVAQRSMVERRVHRRRIRAPRARRHERIGTLDGRVVGVKMIISADQLYR